MKFLIEKNLASPEQERSLQVGSYNDKVKKAYKIIDSLPNADRLKLARGEYADSMIEDGTNTNDNPFLTFMENNRNDITRQEAVVIRNLINNNVISPNEKWLYDGFLYNESPEDNIFRIKALAYASNPGIQKNASKQITIDKLRDKANHPLSAKDMRAELEKIKLNPQSKSSELTLQNGVDALYKDYDLSSKKDAYNLKRRLIKLVKPYIDDENKLNKLQNTSMETLLKLPIGARSEKAIIKTLTDFVNNKDTTNKGQDKESVTGRDILSYYGVKDKETFKNYLIDNVLKDEFSIKSIDDNLEDNATKVELQKILNRDYGNKTKEQVGILNKNLQDIFTIRFDKR